MTDTRTADVDAVQTPAGGRRYDRVLWLFAALALAPLALSFGAEGYLLNIMTRAMIYGIAALSLDLILGFGGLVSFGHAAFLGIGCYAVGILAAHGVDDLVAQLAAAILVALVFGAFTSTVSLRASGVYYIMSTLAFGQMLYFLGVSLSAYGGDDGMSLTGRSTVFGASPFTGDRSFYYLVLAVLFGSYVLIRRLVRSRFGRVLVGVSQNPARMRSIGFEPFAYKLIACLIAGVICAIAGVLLANQTGFVSPAYMSWQRSGELLVMVVLGGIGTIWGPIVGAMAFLMLEESLSGLTEQWKLILGALLVCVALAGRGGLAGIVNYLGAKFGRGGAR